MTRAPSSMTPKTSGFLARCFWGLLKFSMWSVLGWCVALLISVIFLVCKGTSVGLHYLYQLWMSQYQLLLSLKESHWSWHIFIYEGIYDLNNYLTSTLAQSHSIQIAKKSYPLLAAYSQALLLTTVTVISRLGIIILFLPVYVLLSVIGFMDGLVQRDLRRFGGGRESALLYHRAKYYVMPCVHWSCFIYLLLPLPIHPNVVLLPFAILFAFMMALTTKTFKKYI